MIAKLYLETSKNKTGRWVTTWDYDGIGGTGKSSFDVDMSRHYAMLEFEKAMKETNIPIDNIITTMKVVK